MDSYRKEDCAVCKVRTDKPEKVIKYRKNVENLPNWFQQAIRNENKGPWNSNRFICNTCYRVISSYGEDNDEFRQFLETTNDEEFIATRLWRTMRTEF